MNCNWLKTQPIYYDWLTSIIFNKVVILVVNKGLRVSFQFGALGETIKIYYSTFFRGVWEPIFWETSSTIFWKRIRLRSRTQENFKWQNIFFLFILMFLKLQHFRYGSISISYSLLCHDILGISPDNFLSDNILSLFFSFSLFFSLSLYHISLFELKKLCVSVITVSLSLSLWRF